MSGPELSGLEWVVVGFGANLGRPELAFRDAVRLLRKRFRVGLGSRLYTGPALRLPASRPQPDYLNAALLLHDVDMALPELVAALLDVERQLGRVRAEHWGPRTLDLDLLLAGDRVCRSAAARVPHPGLAQRAFALRPLLELVPRAQNPLTGEQYRTILDRLGPDRLRVAGGPEWACAT